MKSPITCLYLASVAGLLQFQAVGAGVVLQHATATFSQTMSGDFSVGRCVDGVANDNFGWAIQGAIQNQTAAFETVQDIGFPGGSLLTFSLVQNGNWWGWTETLGRFRISVTTDDRSTFCDGLPTGGDVTANWTVLQPISYTSLNGASLSRLADDSILAGGTAPLTDTYTITAATPLTGITGIRLEVIQDPSLPSNGPGREPPNGNFILSEFQVSIAPQTGCIPASPGIVSWWRAEGNGDDAVSGNNGTLFTGTGFASGEVGEAFNFDGENSAVVVPAAASLAVQSLTIEGWIVITDTVLARPIVEFANPTGPCAMNLWYNIKPGVQGNSAGLYGFFRDPGGNVVELGTAPGVLQSNQWNHVALTLQANAANDVLALYVNGVNVGVTTSSEPVLWNSFENVNLGYRPVGSSDLWGGRRHLGLLDEISIYNRALSAAEIQAIYTAGSAGKCAGVVPPAISTQPTDQTVVAGGSATFSVGASGTAPLSYQWRFNGGALFGQTGTSLLLANVQLAQAGNYSVVVTNQAGTAISSNAVLTVLGPTTNCVPAPPGLVSWWKGEGNGADVVGSNNGALLPGTTFGSGEVGQAFSFDGENSAVVVPAAANLAVQSITIEGWIIITDTVLARPIVEFANPTGPCAMNMWYNIKPGVQGNSAGLYGFFRDDGGHFVDLGTAPGVLLSNQWNHVALTFQANPSNDVLALYVNGVNVGVTTSTVPVLWNSFENVNLGYRPEGSSDLWGGRRHLGLLDEISIYRRALSASEILAIYNAGSAGKCVPPPPPSCLPAPTNLVSWWRGEGSALDSWGHNKGELHGMTFAPGEVGRAFSFNGTSDYVHIPVAGNLPAASNLNVGVGPGLTLDAWVSPSDIANGHPIIEWSQPVGGAPYGVHLWVGHPSHPPGYFYANVADTGGNWHVIDSDPGLMTANVFQHVAVTYDKTTGLARLFLNGAIVKEVNLGTFTPQTSYELYFGERPPGDINSRFFAGLIDEIDVFSRALEPAEIQAIYNAGSAGKCVVNRPPVANDFRQETLMRQPVTIPDFTFIAASSDPDEDTLTLDSVSPASANGGTVALSGGIVTYTPPAGFLGSDSFSYTISDGNGGTASASVLVLVDPSPFAAHMLPSAFVNSGFQLNFSGYPGATYTLQRAESLAGPWVDLGSVTVDVSGSGTLVDSNPPAGNAFYRAVYH